MPESVAILEKKIIRPNGTEYMTVAVTDDCLEFRNFGHDRMLIKMDVKVLEQLVPFLYEANFWHKAIKND